MKLHLHWSGFTHNGSKKPQNDDSLVAFSSGPSGITPLAMNGCQSLTTEDIVFAISDGVGGANAGHLASSLILQRMAEIIPETFKLAASDFFPDRLAHLEHAIQAVHEDVNRASAEDESHHGMSATIALAWFTPENLYLANVGDSRIYRSRDGILDQLSRDHTTAWAEWKRGNIREVEYRSHPRRSALYEVVGGGHQHLHPHLAAVPFQTGDSFLLCSDGLIDGIWERHIREALSADTSPEEIARRLSHRSITNAGTDDTTLFVVSVSGLG